MQNAPLGAFCNTFDLHYAIISLENPIFVFFRMAVLHRFYRNFYISLSSQPKHMIRYSKDHLNHEDVNTEKKPVLKGLSQRDRKLVFKTNYCLMQVKSIAECFPFCRMLQGEHSAILLTFIKLPFVIKIFVLLIFQWPFYTRFTVHVPVNEILVFITLLSNEGSVEPVQIGRRARALLLTIYRCR